MLFFLLIIKEMLYVVYTCRPCIYRLMTLTGTVCTLIFGIIVSTE